MPPVSESESIQVSYNYSKKHLAILPDSARFAFGGRYMKEKELIKSLQENEWVAFGGLSKEQRAFLNKTDNEHIEWLDGDGVWFKNTKDNEYLKPFDENLCGIIFRLDPNWKPESLCDTCVKKDSVCPVYHGDMVLKCVECIPEEKRWFFNVITHNTSHALLSTMQKAAWWREVIEVTEEQLPYLEKPTGELAEFCEFRLPEELDTCLSYYEGEGHSGFDIILDAQDRPTTEAFDGRRWCEPKAKPQGLYGKYNITKADGSPCEGRYFVLKLDSKDKAHARACRSSALAYAYEMAFVLPELSADLVKLVRKLDEEA